MDPGEKSRESRTAATRSEYNKPGSECDSGNLGKDVPTIKLKL